MGNKNLINMSNKKKASILETGLKEFLSWCTKAFIALIKLIWTVSEKVGDATLQAIESSLGSQFPAGSRGGLQFLASFVMFIIIVALWAGCWKVFF